MKYRSPGFYWSKDGTLCHLVAIPYTHQSVRKSSTMWWYLSGFGKSPMNHELPEKGVKGRKREERKEGIRQEEGDRGKGDEEEGR